MTLVVDRSNSVRDTFAALYAERDASIGPAADPDHGSFLEHWKSQWWVQIRNRSGKVGWTNQPEKFDGKDALG
ncbi:MAG TPA: hypothetical protein VFT47_08915 [Vicinamibacterales bacterium]|nr:hypothetical protein [Vicinamibacterales bacterium]